MLRWKPWNPGICALLLLVGCSSDPPGWEEISEDLASRWPDVNQLSTENLASKLRSGERILLVDVRHPAEYKVSHLPDAVNVPDGSAFPEDLGEIGGYDTIVFYCSVGYRSSSAAAQAAAGGTSQLIYNLEGSIFQWANEGRPLENANGVTKKVHPFDDRWGQLLEEEYRAPQKK